MNVTGVSTAGAINVQMGNVTGMKTINVSGNPGGVITFAGIQTSGVTTLDASGVTSVAGGVVANFATSTSTAGLTLTGGTGNDSLSGGLGADTIVGGSGSNFMSGGASDASITGGS